MICQAENCEKPIRIPKAGRTSLYCSRTCRERTRPPRRRDPSARKGGYRAGIGPGLQNIYGPPEGCGVPECPRGQFAKGLCTSHYFKARVRLSGPTKTDIWSWNRNRGCKECASLFRAKAADTLFCSRTCASKYVARSRAIYDHTEFKLPRPCKTCATMFVPPYPSAAQLRGEYRLGVYCSKKCQFTDQRIIRTCVRCGAEFYGKTTDYCSRVCKKEATQKPVTPKIDRNAGRLCKCGASLPPSITNPRRHCLACSQLKLLKYPFNPRDVFSQAGWRCYLCLKPTPKRLQGTAHPHAPTIDHVIPRARGGTNDLDNVKCACRACNSAKRDLPLWEFWSSLPNQEVNYAT